MYIRIAFIRASHNLVFSGILLEYMCGWLSPRTKFIFTGILLFVKKGRNTCCTEKLFLFQFWCQNSKFYSSFWDMLKWIISHKTQATNVLLFFFIFNIANKIKFNRKIIINVNIKIIRIDNRNRSFLENFFLKHECAIIIFRFLHVMMPIFLFAAQQIN